MIKCTNNKLGFLKNKRKRIKIVKQHDMMDCGPACLSMITSYFGIKIPLFQLRELCQIGKDGVSMLGIIHAAKKSGFSTKSLRINFEQLVSNFDSPCLLHWNKKHFVILESILNMKGKLYFKIADPAHGKVSLTEAQFIESWVTENNWGIALFLKPNQDFYSLKEQKEHKIKIGYLWKLLVPYKNKIILLILFVFLGSILSISLPFFTEFLIDKGVVNKDIDFITLILSAQLFVFIGIMVVNALRNWYTLFIGANFSVDIIYSYLDKIVKLPINFFDTKNSGDFSQRIQDNVRIEEFFTSDSILTIFSFLTLILYSAILFYYNEYLFLLYLGLTFLAILWSLFWLKKRKNIDYQLFRTKSENQEAVYEFYNGISEMKLNQYEDYKKKQWIKLQKRLLNTNIHSLKIEQIQYIGFEFFNQIKNILSIFITANYVIKDKMTLGALLSVSFIIGQMNSPIHQLLSFIKSQQDAFLSFNRLGEVYSQQEEDNEFHEKLDDSNIPVNIKIESLNFKYNILSDKNILENINITIPKGKVTAIVGHSGSGKTTLMKLLLKFFSPLSGKVIYGSNEISNISANSIREVSGIVMQDGYIFNDTIERNIVMGDSVVNQKKLENILKAVNLYEFVNSLALKELTKIGSGGNNLSGGQKQRVLIARALYKSPKYIFLDEATSALDATNEKLVYNNLQKLFIGKTVVVIAHRLSTVKNADQIIVLSKGKVVEAGSHFELIEKKGHYYSLVKDQLDI